jgi:hypothetical protein
MRDIRFHFQSRFQFRSVTIFTHEQNMLNGFVSSKILFSFVHDRHRNYLVRRRDVRERCLRIVKGSML